MPILFIASARGCCCEFGMAGFWDYFEAAGMKTLVYEICCGLLLL